MTNPQQTVASEFERTHEAVAWDPMTVLAADFHAPKRPGLRCVWETFRHLKFGQVCGQIRRRIFPSGLMESAPSLIPPAGRLPLRRFLERDACHEGGGRFRFLHHLVDLGTPIDWDAPGQSHLWRYHLHYFDCLSQPDFTSAEGWRLMRTWIARHPPRRGAVGWEPYPLSLRIVNWLKFLQTHGEFPEDIVGNLALQGGNLARQVERHLRGNHLLANAKALWWLGVFLKHESWRNLGRRIVLSELPEQFLPDGGHFELSPMYHALMLEDLLDLINLADGSGDRPARGTLARYAARALEWLNAIVDGHDRIPLLNDSTGGMARPPGALRDYAKRLEILETNMEMSEADRRGVLDAPAPEAPPPDGFRASRGCLLPAAFRWFTRCRNPFTTFGLKPPAEMPGSGNWSARDLSGYQILRNDRMRILFDTAPLGPDYLPGHAHSDLLAVLMDFDGEPVFTDTGVMEYAEGPVRAYCRSAAAHNTVSLDGLDHAELWKSFRIGRRGRPRNLYCGSHPLSSRDTDWYNPDDFTRARGNLKTLFQSTDTTEPTNIQRINDAVDPRNLGDIAIRCAHDGFARQRRGLWHERAIYLLADGFRLIDQLSGPGRHRFTSRFHLAPGIHVEEQAGCWWINGRLGLTFFGATARLETTPFFPEFGRAVPRPCLVLTGDFHRRVRLELRCKY